MLILLLGLLMKLTAESIQNTNTEHPNSEEKTMDINYELYKVFYQVAKSLSFSEAAETLYISLR